MKKALFYFLQFTWGLLMNLIGAVVFVLCTIRKRPMEKVGPYICFTVPWMNGGLSTGLVICTGTYDKSCIPHEMGHGIQNALFGPLFPFLIALPSLIRYWYREIVWRKDPMKAREFPPYNSIWFEHQATDWGEEYYYNHYLKKN